MPSVIINKKKEKKKKKRMERYPEGSCYFAIVKQMLKGFNLVLAKGTLWPINHLNIK